MEQHWRASGRRSRDCAVRSPVALHFRDFIFNPSALPPGMQERLEEEINRTSLVSCAPPGLPILVVGTDESTVILFDTRDAQIMQEIDISSGHPGAVAGLLFLSDRELVAVGSEGQVVFLSA
jgi:WD40 repeat protein